MNENVCKNEVSVLSKDEFDTNQVSDSSETFLDPFTILKEVHKKKSNRPIVAQLNINSLKNKFDFLKEIVKDNVDILIISETKIDSSSLLTQFYMDSFTTYRRDRNINGGGIILYIRDDIL